MDIKLNGSYNYTHKSKTVNDETQICDKVNAFISFKSNSENKNFICATTSTGYEPAVEKLPVCGGSSEDLESAQCPSSGWQHLIPACP